MALLTSYLAISQPPCQVALAFAEGLNEGINPAGNTACQLCNIIHMNESFCILDTSFLSMPF